MSLIELKSVSKQILKRDKMRPGPKKTPIEQQKGKRMPPYAQFYLLTTFQTPLLHLRRTGRCESRILDAYYDPRVHYLGSLDLGNFITHLRFSVETAPEEYLGQDNPLGLATVAWMVLTGVYCLVMVTPTAVYLTQAGRICEHEEEGEECRGD
jgi:hypothetical protein